MNELKDIYNRYKNHMKIFEENSQPMDIDKEKQQKDVVQDENMLLYKLYNIFSEYD